MYIVTVPLVGIGSGNKGIIDSDNASEAAFYSPYAAVWINDTTLLVSERFKNVFRVVTFDSKYSISCLFGY